VLYSPVKLEFKKTMDVRALDFLLLLILADSYPNGTLIPSYFCGPIDDGYPRDLGDLDVGDQHSGAGPKNVVWIAPNNADINTGRGIYSINPGQVITLAIAVNCAPDPPKSNGFNAAGIHLTGFLAYAIDTASGERIGSWVNVGPTLMSWNACNLNGKYSNSVGIVNSDDVAGEDESSVGGLTWRAPQVIKGNVRFIGYGVTDCGYGMVDITYNVTGNYPTAPSIKDQGLMPNAKNDGKPFVMKGTSADLDERVMMAAANANVNTNPVTVGGAIGIGVGSAFAGIFIASVFFFVINRRRNGTIKAPLLM
jgi:hypothetical protein